MFTISSLPKMCNSNCASISDTDCIKGPGVPVTLKNWFYKAFLHGQTCSQVFSITAVKGSTLQTCSTLTYTRTHTYQDTKVCNCTHGISLRSSRTRTHNVLTCRTRTRTHTIVPISVPMVPELGKHTQDHIYSTNKVSKKTVIIFPPPFFLFLFFVYALAAHNFLHCFVHAGENFWNLNRKIAYLWWNILIYKDENRHSVLSFHPHIFFLYLYFPILIKHCASISPPPHILVWGLSAEQSWMALDFPI